MKKIILILLFPILILLSCQDKTPKTEEKLSNEEKTEIEEVEIMQKTDQERADSMKAKWEQKMEESKLGE